MPIAASKIAGAGSSTAVTTASFPAQAAGTWLVLQVSSDDYRLTTGTNRPESSGWTSRIAGQDELGSYVWTKLATGSETSVTYAIGSAVSSAWEIIAVTGATDTLDNTPAATHTHGGATTASGAVTPSAGNRYVLALCGAYHSNTNMTSANWSNSYSAVGFQAGPSAGSRENVAAAGLATSAGASTSTTATWIGAAQLCSYGTVLVFREASGGGGTTHVASPADSVGVTDSVSVSVNYSRTVDDAVGIVDTGSQALDLAQTIPDPVGIYDSVTVVRSLARTIADSVGVTDSASTSTAGSSTAAPTDPVAVTDAVSVVQAFARTIADAVGLADNATVSVTAAGAANQPDAVAVTDQVVTAMQSARAHDDPVALTDALTLLAGRVITEPIGVTDSVTVSLTGANGSTTSDGVGIGDQAGVVLQVTRTATDAIGVTDTVSAVLIVDPSGYADIDVKVSLAPRRTTARLGPRAVTASLGERRASSFLEER